MTFSRPLTPLLLLSAVAAACGGQQNKPTPTESPEAITAGMHRHFDDVNQIQTSLISGDLPGARRLAGQLRAGFSGPMPAGWKPFVERTIASAEMMEASDNIEMAAHIAGTMAGTCGACHEEQGLEVLQEDGTSPSEDDFMRRHRWASEQLWNGIIGPSDSAWQAGAAVLRDSKFTAAEVEDYIVTTPEIEELIAKMQASSEEAQSTVKPEERQRLYGNLLAGCALCHSKMLQEHD